MNPEVLIIGGGVIGLGIARELHKKGARGITIVDRGPIGCEASWAAAGMLAPNIETDASPDFHRFGIDALHFYPQFAAEVLDETGVDIELDRSGTLCLAFTDAETEELNFAFARHVARGIRVEQLSSNAIRELEPAISTDARSALLFHDDWQVENRKLVSALRAFAEKNEISVVEQTKIEQLLVENGRVVGAATASGEIHADTTVVATGAWTSFIKIGEMAMPFAVKPIRGQMISFNTPTRELQRVVYSPRGYVVPRADGRVLMGATVEDVGFDKSTTQEALDELKDAAVEILPALERFPIGESWAGLRPFAADGLPVIGQLPGYENAIVATAHYRNGILLAPLTARLVAEKIIDGSSPEFLESFDPERFSRASNATAQ